MAGCYLCGTPLAKGQGVRRNVRTGTSVAGLFSTPPSLLLVVLAVLAGGKVPSIRSYFALRTLCPPCGQRLDAHRSLGRQLVLLLVSFVLLFAMAMILTDKH
jgi:hypothetical protein